MRTFERLSLYHDISSYLAKTISLLGLAVALLGSSICFADYKKIIEKEFWGKLYAKGGNTFYCQTPFEKESPILTVSHIYPTALITKELNCRSERSCLRSTPKFEEILSDMHNMVPVNSFYHFSLKDSVFGNLEASNEANECGIKKRYNIIEPPDRIKGDIARMHFYMHKQHQLPLGGNFTFLKAWHEKDPVSQEEIAKNKLIVEIQGNDNPYVTDPKLADKLEF